MPLVIAVIVIIWICSVLNRKGNSQRAADKRYNEQTKKTHAQLELNLTNEYLLDKNLSVQEAIAKSAIEVQRRGFVPCLIGTNAYKSPYATRKVVKSPDETDPNNGSKRLTFADCYREPTQEELMIRPCSNNKFYREADWLFEEQSIYKYRKIFINGIHYFDSFLIGLRFRAVMCTPYLGALNDIEIAEIVYSIPIPPYYKYNSEVRFLTNIDLYCSFKKGEIVSLVNESIGTFRIFRYDRAEVDFVKRKIWIHVFDVKTGEELVFKSFLKFNTV